MCLLHCYKRLSIFVNNHFTRFLIITQMMVITGILFRLLRRSKKTEHFFIDIEKENIKIEKERLEIYVCVLG